MDQPAIYRELRSLGAATVYKAQGAKGALDSGTKPIDKASRLVGPALTVDTRPADNRKQMPDALTRVKSKGLKVNEPTLAEMDRMRAAVKPMQEKYLKNLGDLGLVATRAGITCGGSTAVGIPRSSLP